ncbi:MAG: SGNH/GDSL hydrolase family protein [Clostridia bacterium]|nr:SGNH/GDSL hydrolase family protein [Clostridia bacterium]
MDISKYYISPAEKPLDIIKPDGGFTGIFRTIACIGDSLSSGEFESLNENNQRGYHDMFEYSWGQYIARAVGAKVYNFSRGGMTASEYMNSWGDANGVWDQEKACQAYIFALGVNDVLNQRQPLGSAADIDLENPENNAKTFAGYFGKILSRYKKIQPKARFFMLTMPRSEEAPDRETLKEEHAKLLYDIAQLYEFTYVIDLNKYAPVYDRELGNNFFLSGHMNAQGYIFTAHMVMSYIDYIIRKYPADFMQVPFIGTPYKNINYKW